LLVLDVETTGLDEAKYDICEIGVVVLTEHLSIVETFDSKVKPISGLRDPEAMRVNGLNEVLLAQAPSLRSVLESLDRIIIKNQPLTLAGWGVHFDARFLKAGYAKVESEYPLSYRLFDIKSAVIFYAASQGKNIGWHGVTAALKALDMEFEGREHSAIADAVNTVRLIRRCAGVA
jgi:DNA polymerase III epsilon subunit-like protein